MNNLKRKNKGITLITLVVAVTILIIISSLLIYNATNGIEMRNLRMMYNDIELLSDKVNSYYTKYGALPAEIEYQNNINFEPQPNDTDKYYVIDLYALDEISLNYGYDFENIHSSDDTLLYNDVYIINEQSHHIYYAKGIEMDDVVYYTNDDDESVSIKPLISINLTLTYENQKLNVNELPNLKEVTSENVPIPKGFYYVGGTKDEGVVISDVEGDDLDNSKQGNQFVWVPVNQNQKLMLEVESKEDITEIIVTQPDGTQSTINASGKEYSGEIQMTKNGIYEVEVKTATTLKTASKRISSLYAQDVEAIVQGTIAYLIANAQYVFDTTEEFLQEVNYNTIDEVLASSGYENITSFMIGENVYIKDLNEIIREQMIMQYSSFEDYNRNPESVNKYGGFYIGRFEAGAGDATTPRRWPGTDTNTLVTKKGVYIYNLVSSNRAKSLASEMYNENDAVTSQLITGSGWVRTLNWLVETGNKTEEEVFVNSMNWGNYNKSTGNAAINSGESNMNFTTGRSEYWKANNIYDLAGNMWEWTQETLLGNYMDRGGGYDSLGEVNPASTHYYGRQDPPGPDWEDDNDSFRVELYINV